MALYDTYSKRLQRQRGPEHDVYTYDILPDPLRVQIVQLLREGFGTDKHGSTTAQQWFEFIEATLAREYGQFTLGQSVGRSDSSKKNLENFILSEPNVERVIDVVELSFRAIDNGIRKLGGHLGPHKTRVSPDQVLKELNVRFQEHGVGFKYENGEMFRVDSELVHQEITKPALRLLVDKRFAGPNEEFIEAHEHYRKGANKECLVSALKSFESTIRVVLDMRGTPAGPTDNASKLVSALFATGIIPKHLESQFTALRSVLESGVPTLRNREGGHGQGGEIKTVPDYLGQYGLGLTASAILLVVKANASNPPK